jgi:hypothetical protein
MKMHGPTNPKCAETISKNVAKLTVYQHWIYFTYDCLLIERKNLLTEIKIMKAMKITKYIHLGKAVLAKNISAPPPFVSVF